MCVTYRPPFLHYELDCREARVSKVAFTHMCQPSLRKTEKGWDGMETWSIGSQRKKTNKTHADARKVITLFTLEPDYVISTTEFISSFRFVSNQSESF